MSTNHFTCSGRTLVETCVNDLKLMSRNVRHGAGLPKPDSTRREAVIILHASGQVTVVEGWNIQADDVPELLAARVLRGT
jgi:hypothetical protein